jgi:hypothetical protein
VLTGADREGVVDGSSDGLEHPLSATAIDAAITAARDRERLATARFDLRPLMA